MDASSFARSLLRRPGANLRGWHNADACRFSVSFAVAFTLLPTSALAESHEAGSATGIVWSPAVLALAGLGVAAIAAAGALLWRAYRRQALFAQALDSLPQAGQVTDGAGRPVYDNPACRAWLQSPGQRLIDAVRARIAEDDPDAIVEVLEAAAARGETMSREVRLQSDGGESGRETPAFDRLEVRVSPLGRAGHVLWSASAATATGGPGSRSVVRGPSPETEMAQALAVWRRRLERFFDEAPAGIVFIGADGKIADCNPAFARLLQAEPEALAGRRLAELVAEERKAEVEAALRGEAAAADGTQAEGLEVRFAADPQATATMFVTGAANLGTEGSGEAQGAGEGEGAIVHFIDVSERKTLEEQFAQSQKMQAVGQLAGGIAHDFNNLLTAMIGFCDLLLLRHPPGDQSFADIMQIKQNANRAANLVRQLLAFSRQQTLRPRVLDITNVLAEISHLLRRLIGDDIRLEIVHGRDLGRVKVDQGQLEQVIINLAVNARDAMADGGTLSIRTRNETLGGELRLGGEVLAPGRYVVIEVEDTGCGIATGNLGRIFDPFFSTKELGAGTGLGLSTVYGIVRQTGGVVRVDSKPGRGTTFSIYLPHHAPCAAEEARPQAAGVRDLTGMGTVLLVEDEDAVRAFSARALTNKGYRVIEANSAEAALEALGREEGRVDLMITDVVMPGLDGPALVRRVRDGQPGIKILFISGYTEDSVRRRLDREQDVHFLAKPFSLRELAGKVKELMQEPAGA